MITAEQAWADQQDLDSLFEHWTDESSVEKYARNAGYGWAGILKDYAGYPSHLPVEAVIPHGVYLDLERVAQEEADAPVPAVLNYPAFRESVWKQVSDKVVIPSASPFLYALSLFRRRFPQSNPSGGTIFFLAHGTETQHRDADWGLLVRTLNALDEEHRPVSVCVHMSEYEKGLHQVFRHAGFEVVSAGNPWDSEFIYRWLHLLSRHRYAASNDVGGCAYYSVEAGTPFFLAGERPVGKVDPALHVVQQQVGMFYRATSRQMRETAEQIRKVFVDEDEAGITKPDLTDYLLGAQHFKSPSELRHVLEHAADLAEG